MQISLSPEFARIVEAQMAAGNGATAEEVVLHALEMLEHQVKADAAELTAFQQDMQERIDSLDRGEFLEPEEVMARFAERTRLRRLTAA